MFYLLPGEPFPPVSETDSNGILAVTRDLTVERLLDAYSKGIFPWYNEDEPVLWWCPDPRMALFPNELLVSKSMRKIFRDEVFHFTENQCFTQVIEECQKIPRKGQDGTWITSEIIEAYTELHHLGKAKSVEVWQNNELVGGLYGVEQNPIFCGESMFAKVSNASKAGFIWFVNKYQEKYKLIDCQVYTKHLASLGAREIPRKEFLEFLH